MLIREGGLLVQFANVKIRKCLALWVAGICLGTVVSACHYFPRHWSPYSYSSIYHRRCLVFLADSFAKQNFLTLPVRDGHSTLFSVHGETVIQGQEFMYR